MKRKSKTKDNKYWLKDGDKFLREQARKERCAVCGATPAAYHHLLPKSRYARYRFTKQNLLPLCSKHHVFGVELAAHSQCYIAVEAFINWLKRNRPKQYKWTQKAAKEKSPMRRINYEELYNNMLKEFEKENNA
jgi:hypothetical protein